jgi:hypothetical protein
MTVGFPDYQASSNTTGPPIANQAAFSLSNATPFNASGPVASWASSRIRVFPSGSGQGCTVTVTYYADAALTQPVGSYQWIIAAPSALAVVTENLGPFVNINVTTTTVAAFNCLIQLIPQSAGVTGIRYIAVGNEAHMVNVSVPASTTTSVAMPFTTEGPGQWTTYARDASAKLNVAIWQVGQNGGQSIKLDEQDGIVNPTNRPLYGGNQSIVMFVTNTDGAAAHSLDARVVIDGR